ncbi:MAG: matrixin family metalloprotease [Candidatus Paceibacterota bacterium]|jgi:predicted Zn-dependent protease
MRADTARWAVFVFVALAAGSGLYYRYQDTRPCLHPIAYAIGIVDERFELENSTLLSKSFAAASIWNTAAGKTVLVYDPKAALKINLVYDAREATSKLSKQIAARQAEQDAVRATIDAKQAEYERAQAAYNAAVQAVNARGGATRSEAAALASQLDALNVLADALKSEVATYNANIAALNAVVKEFNQVAGRTFEEGQYVRDASGERINIFEFSSNTQLERVLAHEFGHALGLDHNDDPKSIMFAKNESGNLTPTASDLAALRSVCGA